MEPGEAIVAMVSVIVVFGIPALMFKWWLAHRAQTERPAVPAASDERMARMEQAIDAIAVEIERISEGQRFTTKLLSDRASAPVERRER